MSWDIAAQILTGLGTAVALWLAARATARGGKEAAQVGAEVQDRANDIDGFDRLTQRLEAESARYEVRLERVEHEAETCREENRDLKRRVEDLESKHRETTTLLRDTRTLLRLAADYIGQLRAVLTTRKVDAPEPPPALLEHLTDPPPGWDATHP